MNEARFEDLLRRVAGLDANALGKGVLERAIGRRQSHTRSAGNDEYYQALEQSRDEVQQLIDEVVVLETSFFRDAGAFTALQEWVRDEWMASAPSRALNILSLPSSTGEEPYSIAMALLDLGAGDALRFRVDAVDISLRAIRHARAGVFGNGSFRGRQLDYRDRYFTRTSAGHEISTAVREHVEFKQGNLLDSALTERRYDVVFCRNLLIYFDAQHQKHAMERLLALLNPEGLLFLGPAETFLTAGTALQSLGRSMSFGFRRTANAPATHGRTTAVQARASARTPSDVPPVRSVPPSHMPARFTPSATAAPAARATRVAPPAPAPAPLAAAAAARESASAQLLEQAESLANGGRLDEAASACRTHISRFGVSAPALFLLGVVSQAQGDTPLAISSFRKVLYLEAGHEQALLHLSMLAREGGVPDRARQLDRRARTLGRERNDGRDAS